MQGHIRQRSRGSWTVVVDLGRDPATGKRRQIWRSVKGSKREAEALLLQLLHQKITGIDTPPGKLTVADFLLLWLDTFARPNTAPRTHRRYEQIVRRHLTPAIGATMLTRLRPLHIQEAYARIAAKGLAPRTVLHCHRVLKEALGHALKWQLLSRNPADAVDPPRASRYEVPVMPLEDLKRLLAIADETPYGVLVNLAVMTGLRSGELLGLRWRDVDLEAGVLRVRQISQWLPKEGFSFRQPKTYRSTRPVSLGPASVESLKQHRVAQLQDRLVAGSAYQDNDLVFASPVGRPVHPSTLRQGWLKILAGAGLKLRFHDLRHVHASLMLQSGVHPKIVSERLGHSTVGVTLDLYSHVAPTLQAEAAGRLEELLANG